MSWRLVVDWKSGVVKKFSLRSIQEETLCENCSTCLRIYRRNASEDQRPIIMIENVGTLSRYIAIAAPDLIECVPMSSGLKPSLISPRLLAAERSLEQAVVDDIDESLP